MWARAGNIPAGRKADPGVTAADSRPFGGAAPARFRTGSPWRGLPERFGKWNGVSRRFRRRALSGVSGRVFRALPDGSGLDHVSVDGTVVQAHRKHPCLESSPDPAFFPFFPGSVSGCPGPFHSVPHRRRRPGTPEAPAGETPAGPPVIRFRCRTDAVRPAVRRRPPSGPPTSGGRGEGRWRSRPACA